MTTQEALTILHCPDAYGGISGQAYGQALHMAITALRAWKGVQTDIKAIASNAVKCRAMY